MKLIDIFTDYENIRRLISGKLTSHLIEKNEYQSITEEHLDIPIINRRISQRLIHKKINSNNLEIKIDSGPLRNTVIDYLFEKNESGTKVTVTIDLKLELKYKIFEKFIKEIYLRHINYVLSRIDDLVNLTKGRTWKESLVDNGNGIIISKENMMPITLYGWESGGIHDVFVVESYKFLPVNKKTVIDIGANIGDSAIYFALQGAERVIAVEPFPKNMEFAKKNIDVNNFSGKITLLLGGISSKPGGSLVDSEVNGIGVQLTNEKRGIKIPLITLEDILTTYNVQTSLLKLDCEGCEYDAIVSSPIETLRKFSHIAIEFHNGYENLRQKLLESGFKVTVSDINSKNKTGNIYATRE